MKSSVDNNWYAWIYALGSKVSEEYISQITLKNGNDIHETLTYRLEKNLLNKRKLLYLLIELQR